MAMAKAPKSLNVSLTPELTKFISVRVASGRYHSASEVVRAGLRLLERDESTWAERIGSNPSAGTQAQNAAGSPRD